MSDIEKFISERKTRSPKAWAGFEQKYATTPPGASSLFALLWRARRLAEREGFEPFSASKLSRLIHADLVDG
ncbi:MAG: hypothetical protein WC378_19075 [Opitutaceae bacterium]|jgi:hypothetical protein